MTRTEATDAIARVRDRQFAELVLFAVGLAAEHHPEKLRKSLALVFDLSAVEETTKLAMIALQDAQKQVQQVRHALEDLKTELRRIEDQLASPPIRRKAQRIVNKLKRRK